MITFQRSHDSNPDFRKFCEDSDKEFGVRYPDFQHNFVPYNKIDESARIIVVYDDEDAIGCGCFRNTMEQICIEIKRMYVRPDRRGVGLARRILLELETWAVEQGYTQSILETGLNQPEAIALYARAGYRIIPNYPPYVDVEESICMKKNLTNSPLPSR